MPPRQKKTAEPEKHDTVAGIVFLEESEEPPLPRKHDRDDKFWLEVKAVLEMAPNKWAKVKEYDTLNAATQKAANINGGRNKMFPKDCWEARYKRDAEANTSTLFLRCVKA